MLRLLRSKRGFKFITRLTCIYLYLFLTQQNNNMKRQQNLMDFFSYNKNATEIVEKAMTSSTSESAPAPSDFLQINNIVDGAPLSILQSDLSSVLESHFSRNYFVPWKREIENKYSRDSRVSREFWNFQNRQIFNKKVEKS